MAKVKIPKKVAGVKVPKKLRKEAKRAIRLTESKAVRDLALAGLTLAAENLLSNARVNKTANAAAQDTVRAANLKALHLGDVLRQAAVEGARRFLDGFEEAQRATVEATQATVDAARPSAAKPRRRRANGRGAAAE